MKSLILLSEGYEEIEALTVVDYLRRANLTIDMVSTVGKLDTTGDHGIQIKADYLLEDVNLDDYDLVVTPGGLPGAKALAADERVTKLLNDFYKAPSKWVASICASPLALEAAGVAKEIKGTCYPGFEKQVHFKEFSEDLVVIDQQVITSRGPATAVYFALAIIEQLAGRDAAIKVSDGLLLPLVEMQYLDEDPIDEF